MPNGDPNWGTTEYPKLEAFFSRIVETLEGFANDHNLKISKYYHQFPSWDFLFRHPMGGAGQIEIHKHDDRSIKIMATWWIDKYEEKRRYWKSTIKDILSIEDDDLQSSLDNLLREVMAWKLEELSPVNQVYSEWKKISKRKLEQELEKYPIPKL